MSFLAPSEPISVPPVPTCWAANGLGCEVCYGILLSVVGFVIALSPSNWYYKSVAFWKLGLLRLFSVFELGTDSL